MKIGIKPEITWSFQWTEKKQEGDKNGKTSVCNQAGEQASSALLWTGRRQITSGVIALLMHFKSAEGLFSI